MTFHEQLRERERQWRLYHEWEEQNPPPDRPLEAIMADLSAIWRRLPADVRSTDPDPQKLGVRYLHETLKGLDDLQESRTREVEGVTADHQS